MLAKGKLKILGATLMTVFTLGGTVFGSFAWFVATKENPAYKINGKSAGAYFAYGNGTREKPYGISVPRHLYNLSWLHYMGQFDDGQYYFELANSVPSDGLNMENYVIPPIGTEDKPFVGNFNGNNKIIKNLTVTNDKNAIFNSQRHPDASQVTYEAPEIVGLFGVVGNLNGAYSGSYSSSVNTIYNLGITGFTIETTTAKALVGICAGYVNAQISNVAINSSSIDIKRANTQCVDAVNLTDNLSDYTAVGYCTEPYIGSVSHTDGEVYGIDVEDDEFSVNDVGDGGVASGGTVNMTNMYQRLLSIFNVASNTNMVYNKTVLYDKEDQNGNRAIKTSTNTKTSSGNTFRTYHDNEYKSGFFNYAYYNNSNYMCMAGGHYADATYIDDYYQHNGYLIKSRVSGTTYYLGTSSSAPTNNSSVTRTTEPTEALVWTVFEGDTGKIYTTYNNQNYYLQVYNTTTLRYTTTQGNGTTFTKEVSNGKTRFTYNNRYIGYSNNAWTMLDIPTVPVNNPPAILDNPGTWEEYEASHGVTWVDGDYQITFTGSDGRTKYLSYSGSTIQIVEAPIARSWDIDNTSIRNTDTTQRYISQSNNSTVTLVTSNAQTWSVNNSGSTYWFQYDYTSGSGCNAQTTTYYLKYTDDGLTIATGNNGNYQFTAVDAQTAINDFNESGLYAAWQNAVQDYNDSVTAYNTYVNETYPNEYNQYLERLAATYNCTLDEISVELGNTYNGPDYYLDNSLTYQGMLYDYNDTTYFPLNVVEDGTQTQANFNKYYPKASNTGYVISGSNYTSSTTYNNNGDASDESIIRVSKYDISRISNSYSGGSFQKTNGTENIYTIDSSYNIVKASDSLYENYSKNRDKLETVLDLDASYVYGLHFMNQQIDIRKLVQAKYVVLNTRNEPYVDYELPANSINFHLIEQGYINFFGGMFFNNPNNDAFISLHKVLRNANHKITEIKEIEAVYSDGVEGHAYAYEFTDGKYSLPFQYNSGGAKVTFANGAWADSMNETSLPTTYIDFGNNNTVTACNWTKMFDTQRITNHYFHAGGGHSAGDIINSSFVYGQNSTVDGSSVPTGSSIFYYEIPMNDGEFCLGSVSGGTGGYLFYLDIGANAKKLIRTVFYEHYTILEEIYSFPKGVAFVVVANNFSVNDGDGAFASIEATFNDKVTVVRTGNDIVVTEGYDDDYVIGKYKNATVTFQSGAPPPGGTEIEIVSEEKSSEIRVVEYFDLDAAKNECTRSVISEKVVTTNGVEGSPIVVRKQYVNDTLVYDSTSDDENLNNPANATFYNNAGNKVSITTIGAPGEGTDTEILVVTFDYDKGTVEVGDITFELTAGRSGGNTYYTATGYVVNIVVEDNEQSLDINTGLKEDLSAKYSSITIVVSGHYIITISGASVSAP